MSHLRYGQTGFSASRLSKGRAMSARACKVLISRLKDLRVADRANGRKVIDAHNPKEVQPVLTHRVAPRGMRREPRAPSAAGLSPISVHVSPPALHTIAPERRNDRARPGPVIRAHGAAH